jgi:hypothetical protein
MAVIEEAITATLPTLPEGSSEFFPPMQVLKIDPD